MGDIPKVEESVLMAKTPNIPTWKDLDRILRDDKMTGKITLNCVEGNVVDFEIMQRYKAQREEKDENG